MTPRCLICGRDHPNPVRGGIVRRVDCYKLTPRERTSIALSRGQTRRWQLERAKAAQFTVGASEPFEP